MKIVNPIPEGTLKEILRLIENRTYEHSAACKPLGEGSFGDVFAYGGYAVKVIRTIADPQMFDGEILGKLQGCDLFPKLYIYEQNKFVIMELIDGKNLSKVDANDIILEGWEKEIEAGQKYLDGVELKYADIHLNNVMLTRDGKIKIVDVGHMRCGFSDSVAWIVNYIGGYVKECKRPQANKMLGAIETPFKKIKSLMFA